MYWRLLLVEYIIGFDHFTICGYWEIHRALPVLCFIMLNLDRWLWLTALYATSPSSHRNRVETMPNFKPTAQVTGAGCVTAGMNVCNLTNIDTAYRIISYRLISHWIQSAFSHFLAYVTVWFVQHSMMWYDSEISRKWLNANVSPAFFTFQLWISW